MPIDFRDVTPRIGTEIKADKTDQEQITFTETLGTFASEIRGDKVYKITLDAKVNEQADYLKGSLYWHIDGTMSQVPILASLLSSKVLPSNGGGGMMSIGDRELPLVWTHRSGRKSLVIGVTARHIVNMDFKKSAELLVRLRDWATQPNFVYRHVWSVGDLVIWDNTGTMHRATPYDPNSGRMLHRTKLEGEEAFA